MAEIAQAIDVKINIQKNNDLADTGNSFAKINASV